MFSPDCIINYQSICNDSAFYKLLDSGGEVKVDRGF